MLRRESSETLSLDKFREWRWQVNGRWAVVASGGSVGRRACVALVQRYQLYLKASREPPAVDVGCPCGILGPRQQNLIVR